MRICSSRIVTGLALLLTMSLALPGLVRGQTASYLDYEGFTSELRSLVNGSNLASMESLGTTLGGREVWMVQVARTSGQSLDERPAVLVVGNLEGDHLVGSQLSLEAIRYLVEHAQDEAVASALSEHVFYFFPRLNPDGAEAMFASIKWARKTNEHPFDDDNDGRVDEDGPDDLNGDGYVTVMRVPDPSGAYMIDPADGRLMKRADPTKGETGAYTLYFEGTDNDGDGFINEDGPGGVDLNRNFQHEYPYWQADAGPYMVSEIESRALMDFTISHRNIAAILTFGESDNLVTPPDSRGALASAKVLDLPVFAEASNADVFSVGDFAGGGFGGRGFRGFGGRRGGGGYLRGAQVGADNDPSSGTRPATTVATQDQVYFQAVSDAYKRITGIENVPVHRTPEGAFFQYGYFQFGVLSLSTPGWGLPESGSGGQRTPGGGNAAAGAGAGGARAGAAGGRPAGATMMAMGGRGMGGAQASQGPAGTGNDARILQALDGAGIEAFVDWTPFQHPELGEVEIGGFLPYVTVNPPAEELPELGQEHGQFLVELAGLLPRVRIADTKVEALGGGIFKITADVENSGFFPTALRQGQMSRSVGPTLLQIQVDDDMILTGEDKTVTVGVLDGSGTRESHTWVIEGRDGAQVQIKLLSQKAGTDTATVTLR